MEELLDEVRRVLAEAFPGAQFQLEQESASSRVGGEVVWEGFDGMEQIDRQRRLRDVLRSSLSPEERSRLSILLTFTPLESAVMEEERRPF